MFIRCSMCRESLVAIEYDVAFRPSLMDVVINVKIISVVQ